MINSTATIKNKIAPYKFVIGSFLGIFLFFIKVPINGEMILPIDWIQSLVKGLFNQFDLYIALISSAYVLYNLYNKKFWKGSPFEIILNLLSLVAIVLFLCDLFGYMPQFFIDNGIYDNAIKTMVPFSIGITTIMFFLPPLISYGLPEAIGVFVQPLTKSLLRLPGRTAVIIVSAFMGNFTVGHLQADELYKTGKISHREAAVIATNYCTSSVGLIMSLVAAAGQMSRFTLIFFLIFIVTVFISAVTAHIYPLSKYPDTYYNDIEPELEESTNGNVFKIAYDTGVNACTTSDNIILECLKFGWRSLPAVANIVVSGIACMIVFTVINQYTPIFTWIGMLFYPFIKLVGLQDVNLISGALGINAVDNVTSQLTLVTASGVSPSTILFGCGFGIITVIFFGAFLASLYTTKIKIKFNDLLIIWFERTALTVIIWGIIARILA